MLPAALHADPGQSMIQTHAGGAEKVWDSHARTRRVRLGCSGCCNGRVPTQRQLTLVVSRARRRQGQQGNRRRLDTQKLRRRCRELSESRHLPAHFHSCPPAPAFSARQTLSDRANVRQPRIEGFPHMLVGYMRISSADDQQTVDLQRDA